MWNVIINGNTGAKVAETDGYQWMTNLSKIATGLEMQNKSLIRNSTILIIN